MQRFTNHSVQERYIKINETTGSRITTFKFIKTTQYENPKLIESTLNNLERLKTEDFGKIYIPDFSFEQTTHNTLQITSDFIKGLWYPNAADNRIIEDYLVKRINKPDDPYTFGDLNHHNFLHCNNTQKLFFIDLDCYREYTMEKRLSSWNNKKIVLK